MERTKYADMFMVFHSDERYSDSGCITNERETPTFAMNSCARGPMAEHVEMAHDKKKTWAYNQRWFVHAARRPNRAEMTLDKNEYADLTETPAYRRNEVCPSRSPCEDPSTCDQIIKSQGKMQDNKLETVTPSPTCRHSLIERRYKTPSHKDVYVYVDRK